MIRIAGYALDVAHRIEVKHPSKVTTNPVENGAAVTDHVQDEPIEVTITGTISNTPIGAVVDEREPGALPASDAYEFFLGVRKARNPVKIETRLAVFENMAMTNLSTPVTAATGNALVFTASFRQIDIVESERALVRVEIPQPPGGRRNRGKKPAKKKDVEAVKSSIGTTQKSWMGQIGDTVGGWF